MKSRSTHSQYSRRKASCHCQSATTCDVCTVLLCSGISGTVVVHSQQPTAELPKQLSPVATVSSEAAGERVALGVGSGDLSSPRERSTTPYPLIVVRAAAGGAPRLRGRHAPLRLAFYPPTYSSLREALTYATCAMALMATAEVRT